MKILQAKALDLTEEENVPIRKNCLGGKGLQLIQTFTSYDKEVCKTVEGLFFIGDAN